MEILLIGATGGIGEDFSKELTKRGHYVHGVGRKQEILNSLKEKGFIKDYLIADLSTQEGRRNVVDYTSKNSINCLVYSQGLIDSKPLIQTEEKEIDNVINVNLTSVILTDMEILKRKLNVTKMFYLQSVSSLYSWEAGAAYQASKTGLMAYVSGMRLQDENANRGITRYAIYPDTIDTGKGMSAELAGYPKIPVSKLVDELSNILEGKHYGNDFSFIINENEEISFGRLNENKETRRPMGINITEIKKLGKAVK